jgi:hypothetical protein
MRHSLRVRCSFALRRFSPNANTLAPPEQREGVWLTPLSDDAAHRDDHADHGDHASDREFVRAYGNHSRSHNAVRIAPPDEGTQSRAAGTAAHIPAADTEPRKRVAGNTTDASLPPSGAAREIPSQY